MNLSELFIRRPVMTVLLNLAVVVAGAIAYTKIPVAALPSYNTPVINVSAGGGLLDATGTVLFTATHLRRGVTGVLEEHSRFAREDGRWTYVAPVG